MTTETLPALIPHAAELATLRSAITALSAMPVPPVTDGPSAEAAAGIGKQAKALAKKVDDMRKRAKEPILASGRELDAYADSLSTPLLALARNVEMAVLAWRQAEMRRVEAEARERDRLIREAEVAKRKAEDDLKAAQETQDTDAQLDASMAVAAAQSAPMPVAEIVPPAATGPIRTAHGTMSVRRTIKFEITDPTAVPRELCSPDEGKVGSLIRSMASIKDGKLIGTLPEIAGVRVYVDEKMI
jgi:hypothetical protein